MKCLGIGLASLLIISLCFSLIHAQGSTNQTNLIGLQHQVPWFSFLLFLINASMVEEFLYREILWNLVRKLDIRVALTSVLFALVHHPGAQNTVLRLWIELTKSAQNTVLRLQIELTKSAQNTVLRLQIELTKSVTTPTAK
uniref:CPBP family glutamic-type intramembrane protease n=1 Tax=Streptococcus pneumoniae TaxID=1313 RepID=UPI0038CDA5CF